MSFVPCRDNQAAGNDSWFSDSIAVLTSFSSLPSSSLSYFFSPWLQGGQRKLFEKASQLSVHLHVCTRACVLRGKLRIHMLNVSKSVNITQWIMVFYLCPFLLTYNEPERHAERSALLLISIRGNASLFKELNWTEAGRQMAEKSQRKWRLIEDKNGPVCLIRLCLTCICSMFIHSLLFVCMGHSWLEITNRPITGKWM